MTKRPLLPLLYHLSIQHSVGISPGPAAHPRHFIIIASFPALDPTGPFQSPALFSVAAAQHLRPPLAYLMGSSGESKPSITYDASVSEPLLSSHAGTAAASDEEEQYPPISYNHGPRSLRDLPALLLFLLLSLATFALGVFAAARRNPDATRAAAYSYDPATSSCVRLPYQRPNPLSSSFSPPFFKDLIWTLVATLLLAAPIALSLLWLLRHYAKQVVYATIPFFVLVPAFLNVYWFAACALGPTRCHSFPLAYRILVLSFVFLLIAVALWIIVANWHRIRLTVQIVRVAAAALTSNMILLVVLPGLSVGLLVYFVPIVVFLVLVRFNGRIMLREEEGEGYLCEWKQDSWVPAYFALAIVTMVWSLAAMVEAKVFVISGTIAQWYFSKGDSKPSRSVRSSLRNAFGPSLGTVCFSGMVMGVVRIVRSVVDSVKQEDAAPGFVNLILQCCANFLLSAVDFVNKFTINFAAITGEGYCSSAEMTYELLKRNLLSAVFVETVSTRILIGIVFVLSALYAMAVCAILKAVSALGVEAYVVALLAWLLLIVMLGFFVHVLDNVIDTVYVCYAIDRDRGEVCKQEVHEVYVLLPISRNHRSSLNNRTPTIIV